MSQKFKISLPGSDVKDASVTDSVADSAYPNPKVSTLATPPHAGIIFVNWISSGVTVARGTTKVLHSFAHGYDYVPTAFGSHIFNNGSIIAKGTLPFQIGAIGMLLMDADRTNVNLKYLSFDIAGGTPIPPFTLQVRFYVFAERGLE